MIGLPAVKNQTIGNWSQGKAAAPAGWGCHRTFPQLSVSEALANKRHILQQLLILSLRE